MRAAGAFGSVSRCQLTSLSASTATTLSAFGSSAVAARPCFAADNPSGLST
jgi:hypothetical protein